LKDLSIFLIVNLFFPSAKETNYTTFLSTPSVAAPLAQDVNSFHFEWKKQLITQNVCEGREKSALFMKKMKPNKSLEMDCVSFPYQTSKRNHSSTIIL
jgi:hypothetical protein